jgi:hypothetical protein
VWEIDIFAWRMIFFDYLHAVLLLREKARILVLSKQLIESIPNLAGANCSPAIHFVLNLNR